MNKTIKLASVLIWIAVSTAISENGWAASVTYIVRGNGSGLMNGMAFTDQDFTITASADTANIMGGPVFVVINDSTQVAIDGLGMDDFTNEVQTVSNQNTGLAGFGDNGFSLGVQFVNNLIFSSYDLSTSLPETPGAPVFNSGISFPTVNGGVTWTNVSTVSFEAMVVPEPTLGRLWVLYGLLAGCYWRR